MMFRALFLLLFTPIISTLIIFTVFRLQVIQIAELPEMVWLPDLSFTFIVLFANINVINLEAQRHFKRDKPVHTFVYN